MDYRQKMVLAPSKTRITDNGEDDDDEDLEALRMAALQSLRAKDTPRLNTQIWPQTNRNTQQTAHLIYKERRQPRQSLYQSSSTRQNGGLYFQRHRNPNLIAIVPVEEDVVIPKCEPAEKLLGRASPTQNHEADESKFCRYKDEPSCSEEEDDNVSEKPDLEHSTECPQTGVELSDLESTHGETSEHSEEDEKEEDDDDVLLMADLEEEDSLERLMDEMEKEMSVDKPKDVKRHSKKENKSSKREDTNSKRQTGRTKLETRNPSGSPAGVVSSSSVPGVIKNEPLSPYNRPMNRRRSLSPKPRSRKKSPRKSPRRSPPRQFKKSLRDGREPLRYRSPRKSPSRFSPRPRSPRLSPRRSSPRLSPRLSPYHRLPCRIPRSRSPRMSPRPRSPRSRSPRSPSQRSPARLSPRKLSPPPRLTRSPKLSPRHRSPRLSPRPRSPRLSPRPRSPRISPRRASPRRPSPRSPLRRPSPRARSPGLSPHRSPWSSPRNSPHLSPRRRRSPKELSRKVRPRSVTPASRASPISKRGSSPNNRAKNSPENFVKSKLKQKEELHEKAADAGKGTEGVNNDPVLEARRRKFESVKPIDPRNANKKIKLSRNEKKSNIPDEIKVDATNLRTEVNEEEEYETIETDSYLGADFEFEQDVEDPIEDSPAATIASAVNVCSEIEPAKLERERPVKKKKKKDKELYQVHKGELPLSERIGKEKKCKKRKQVTADSPVVEKTETIFEDLTVDEEEGDLRTELSRRRAERLNRTAPIHQQSVRLVQSAFKGVVSEVVKSNAKSIRKQLVKGADDKQNHKEVRRVTVLHRPDLHESEDETIVDSKVPVRFRLGLNKAAQDTRDSKVSRKNSKRQSRKE